VIHVIVSYPTYTPPPIPGYHKGYVSHISLDIHSITPMTLYHGGYAPHMSPVIQAKSLDILENGGRLLSTLQNGVPPMGQGGYFSSLYCFLRFYIILLSGGPHWYLRTSPVSTLITRVKNILYYFPEVHTGIYALTLYPNGYCKGDIITMRRAKSNKYFF